ncbi:nicotinamide-nucleotide amidohydrolase family protein [archaeon]|nr:nicotinamide-nucleotide amidohydrolase family protein [archaeon]
MKKSVLIIGRFQPFHLGHLHIIEKYHKKKFFIKIGIGSSEKSYEKQNPFSEEERENMINFALKEKNIKNYKIYKIPDTSDDKRWIKNIEKIIGEFNVLFTGNSWVERLFKKDNIEIHKFKEKDGRFGGIKARDIRKKWLGLKSRKGLPKAVHKYLRRIYAFERLNEINDSGKKVHYLLSTNNLSISVAESCTGGAISRALISYPGASKFFRLGVVSYSKDSKIKNLKVSKKIINRYGTISKETTDLMAVKIKKLSKSDYSIGITGHADPSDKKQGKIFLSVVNPKNVLTSKKLKISLKDRNKIINSATKKALDLLYEVIKEDLLLK